MHYEISTGKSAGNNFQLMDYEVVTYSTGSVSNLKTVVSVKRVKHRPVVQLRIVRNKIKTRG